MPQSKKPQSVTLRAYKVGFGDCFLLTFHYSSMDRHVLIDFGTTGVESGRADQLMLRIAQDIQQRCGGKLHAIVVTHRHKDHLSGFATKKNGKGAGDIIASCNPDVIVQPWTEDPKAKPGARTSTTVSSSAQAFAAALEGMHEVAAFALSEAAQRPAGVSQNMRKQISFLGEDNLSNRSAVENLMRMGKRHFYVHFGTASGLETVLPGVKIHVLGPPDLTQSEAIRKERATDPSEFWQLQAKAGGFASSGRRLFSRAATWSIPNAPPYTRWFIRRTQAARGDQLLGLVRALDSAMNNTSVILLFEASGKKLLFPGDAQIENWSFALGKKDVLDLLKTVNLYKVGHHGSRNATPMTLWNDFANRSAQPSSHRLQTVVSTMAGKHGDARSHTEVPRKTLVEALEKQSAYFSTQQLKGKNISRDITIEL